MLEKANRLQDPKKRTTPTGGHFLGRLGFMHSKLILVRLRFENRSFPVFIGYNSS